MEKMMMNVLPDLENPKNPDALLIYGNKDHRKDKADHEVNPSATLSILGLLAQND